jgi:hypothetical protein
MFAGVFIPTQTIGGKEEERIGVRVVECTLAVRHRN